MRFVLLGFYEFPDLGGKKKTGKRKKLVTDMTRSTIGCPVTKLGIAKIALSV
jgi:hypothetical protein